MTPGRESWMGVYGGVWRLMATYGRRATLLRARLTVHRRPLATLRPSLTSCGLAAVERSMARVRISRGRTARFACEKRVSRADSAFRVRKARFACGQRVFRADNESCGRDSNFLFCSLLAQESTALAGQQRWRGQRRWRDNNAGGNNGAGGDNNAGGDSGAGGEELGGGGFILTPPPLPPSPSPSPIAASVWVGLGGFS
ncbi:unnamed protein product [Closterium sp. Yama58-4]|nr:unnamed protein product [Closterium sp. Yama58-4]